MNKGIEQHTIDVESDGYGAVYFFAVAWQRKSRVGLLFLAHHLTERHPFVRGRVLRLKRCETTRGDLRLIVLGWIAIWKRFALRIR